MSVDQLQVTFAGAGYRADRVSSSADGLSIVFVTDFFQQQTPDARVLMVLVYPDAGAAQQARELAEANTPGLAGSPYLIPGYGPSVWFDNMALVQSNWGVLEARYQAQVEADMGTPVRTGLDEDQLGHPSVVVDLDFVALLQRDLADL
jgi:hypothetical protein